MAASLPPLVIVAGSKNPVKVDAVRQAFALGFPGREIVVTGVAAESGVPDQPMGDSETRLGAYNRAKRASELAATAGSEPHFAVGLEGGVLDEEWAEPGAASKSKRLSCMAWMAILHTASGTWGECSALGAALPGPRHECSRSAETAAITVAARGACAWASQTGLKDAASAHTGARFLRRCRPDWVLCAAGSRGGPRSQRGGARNCRRQSVRPEQLEARLGVRGRRILGACGWWSQGGGGGGGCGFGGRSWLGEVPAQDWRGLEWQPLRRDSQSRGAELQSNQRSGHGALWLVLHSQCFLWCFKPLQLACVIAAPTSASQRGGTADQRPHRPHAVLCARALACHVPVFAPRPLRLPGCI